jgi:hypothetical protein
VEQKKVQIEADKVSSVKSAHFQQTESSKSQNTFEQYKDLELPNDDEEKDYNGQ